MHGGRWGVVSVRIPNQPRRAAAAGTAARRFVADSYECNLKYTALLSPWATRAGNGLSHGLPLWPHSPGSFSTAAAALAVWVAVQGKQHQHQAPPVRLTFDRTADVPALHKAKV